MNRMPSIFRCLLQRLRAQDGSLLIEVMIGAVMVVVVSGAVLNGLEGAQDTGQRNKARTESAAIAQQDQERLRAMPVDDLSNYHWDRNIDVAGAPYRVESRSEWVRDANGIVSCTNDSSQAQYMKITSTVSSEVNKEQPLTQTSLVSPPRGTFSINTGTAAVQVVDRDQNPLENVRVDISGPQSLSDITNELGCVVFGFIPEGPWTLEVSSLGLVGWDGNSPYKSDVGVVGGSTVLKKLELDQPSSIIASFDMKEGSAAPVPARSKSMSVANSHLPAPGWKAFTKTSPDFTVRADTLYPFADGYGVYAGDCEANNPTLYHSDYFATTGTSAFVVPDPGGVSNVLVRMPAINVEVQNASGVPMENARVFVKAADANCSETYAQQLTNAAGALPEPGHPFGNYQVCADDGALHRAQQVTPPVANTDPDGTAKLVLRLSSLANGNCAL